MHLSALWASVAFSRVNFITCEHANYISLILIKLQLVRHRFIFSGRWEKGVHTANVPDYVRDLSLTLHFRNIMSRVAIKETRGKPHEVALKFGRSLLCAGSSTTLPVKQYLSVTRVQVPYCYCQRQAQIPRQWESNVKSGNIMDNVLQSETNVEQIKFLLRFEASSESVSGKQPSHK